MFFFCLHRNKPGKKNEMIKLRKVMGVKTEEVQMQ